MCMVMLSQVNCPEVLETISFISACRHLLLFSSAAEVQKVLCLALNMKR